VTARVQVRSRGQFRAKRKKKAATKSVGPRLTRC
jgi:hypothetical protein